jgi:hypothetical protein
MFGYACEYVNTFYKGRMNFSLPRGARYPCSGPGFRRNRSTTDQIFCIRLILEKKWEYKATVHQLFIDFKKAYDSVRREVLYNIVIEFGVPMKLVRLFKMCLNKTYSKACTGKHLSDSFPIQK